MIKAQDSAGDFDFFSPWTWFTIFGWIMSCAALVLVIMLHLKVRPLFFMLMARGSHAAPLGLTLPKLTAVTPVTQPSMDPINNQMDVIVLQRSQVLIQPTMHPTAPVYPGLPSLAASRGATLEQKY